MQVLLLPFGLAVLRIAEAYKSYVKRPYGSSITQAADVRLGLTMATWNILLVLWIGFAVLRGASSLDSCGQSRPIEGYCSEHRPSNNVLFLGSELWWFCPGLLLFTFQPSGSPKKLFHTHSAPNFIKFAPTHPTQALFHTGLIPGETDFRIYRDFGDIPGADFAVLTNGWVYHTWRDDMDHLDFRSVQRYGAAWHSVEMLGR
jgi:hypothetical protein